MRSKQVAPDPPCPCGHAWSTHDRRGCGQKDGHDVYCQCSSEPPADIRARREARRERIAAEGCPDHRRYKVKKQPTSACERCWRMWIEVNPEVN